jgi:hypothetical protein
MSAPVVFGLVALGLALLCMVVYTARRVAPKGTTVTANPQTAEDRGRNYVRIRDDDGVSWTYMAMSGARTDNSGLMRVPQRLNLDVVTRVSGAVVGVGIRVRADSAEALDVRRNGDSAPAQVRILDSGGREVAAARGGLSKFGFT